MNKEEWNRRYYDDAHCEMPRSNWRSRLNMGQMDDMFERIKQTCLEEKRLHEAMKPKDFLAHWGKRTRTAQDLFNKWLNDYCDDLRKKEE